MSCRRPREDRVARSHRGCLIGIDAVAEFEDFVEDMYEFATAQELQVDTLIHENGAAQMEINFLHGEALNLADQVFTFKRTVRETVQARDLCDIRWPSP